MSEAMRKQVAKRIKHLIWANKLKQKELAAMLGTNDSHISLLVHARTGLSMAMALRLAEQFGTGVDWLLGVGTLEDYEVGKGGVWNSTN